MIYIDDARNEYRGMIMSHMIADTREELDAFALSLGMKLSWIHKGSILHYDVCQSTKQRALKAGAKLVTSQELVKIARNKQKS